MNLFKIFKKTKPNNKVKHSLKYTGGCDYVYAEYYEDGTIKEYYVYTDYNYGITWYYQDNCERCSASFEDLLERLHRMIKRQNTNIVEEKVFLN